MVYIFGRRHLRIIHIGRRRERRRAPQAVLVTVQRGGSDRGGRSPYALETARKRGVRNQDSAAPMLCRRRRRRRRRRAGAGLTFSFHLCRLPSLSRPLPCRWTRNRSLRYRWDVGEWAKWFRSALETKFRPDVVSSRHHYRSSDWSRTVPVIGTHDALSCRCGRPTVRNALRIDFVLFIDSPHKSDSFGPK